MDISARVAPRLSLMIVRLFLFTSGLISFLYFLTPQSFQKLGTGDVLGINKINMQMNKPPVETALVAYCLENLNLPNDLNDLYGDYLSKKVKVDLNNFFEYNVIDPENCQYTLTPK